MDKSTRQHVTLISLQGLGNSIINFPIYYQIAKSYDVQIVAYRNGSSSFYRELGANVLEISSLKDLFFQSTSIKTDFSFSFYPNWRRELACLNLSHANEKFHFSTKPILQPFFLGHCLPTNFERHDFENNLEILKVLGLEYTRSISALSDFINKDNKPLNYAVIHPTASTPFKYYPIKFWLEILEYLDSKFDHVYILSGKNAYEQDYVKQLQKPNTTLGIGLSFKEIINVIAGSELFVGLDSAMMHLAAILKVKTVGLWSFADIKRIYPYAPDAYLFVPAEILKAKTFKYPAKELPWFKRINSDQVIEILEGCAPDLRKTDLAGNDIKIKWF